MTPFTIIDACRDPKVFAAAFRDRETWQAWFAFLAALFGLPMDDEQRRLFTECTQRTDRPSTPFNEAWLICGRRSGKSFALALVAVFLACSKDDWLRYLNVGERGTIMVLAADRRQARTIMRYVKGLLQLVPMLTRMIEAERQEAVDLNNRITIEVHTAASRRYAATPSLRRFWTRLHFGPLTQTAPIPTARSSTPSNPRWPRSPAHYCFVHRRPTRGVVRCGRRITATLGRVIRPLIWQASTRTMNPTVPQSFIDARIREGCGFC